MVILILQLAPLPSSRIKSEEMREEAEILEYCEPSETISREQYYLDLLKPEYNILLTAGSPLGYKHNDEAKARMSASKIGNKNAKGGKGRKRAEGAGSPDVPIRVFDKETGMETIYPSMSAVAKALGVPSGSIRMYFTFFFYLALQPRSGWGLPCRPVYFFST